MSQRHVIYFVAISLDGMLAGPNGEIDWLFDDQDYGVGEFYEGIDTVLMGRLTYQKALELGQTHYQGKRNIVFSSTLDSNPDLPVEIDARDPVEVISELTAQPGDDIWLVGGGRLFQYLANQNRVDEIRVSVHPIILGEGISTFDQTMKRLPLHLEHVKTFDSGLVDLRYRFVKP